MSKKWLILGTLSFSVSLSLSIIITRDIKRSALTGLLSIPATAAGVIVTKNQRKQKLNDRISQQQKQLKDLAQQEDNLNNLIALLSDRIDNSKQQEKSLQTTIANLDKEQQQFQTEVDRLQNKLNELSDRKTTREAEVNDLEGRLKQLHQEAKSLFNSQQQIAADLAENRLVIKELESQKSHLVKDLDRRQQEKVDLENEIVDLNINRQELNSQITEQRQQLTIEINDLEQNKVSVNLALEELIAKQDNKQKILIELEREIEDTKQNKNNLDLRIEELQVEKMQLDTALARLNNNKQNLESQCNSDRLELEDLERQQTELKQDIDKLNSLITELDNNKQNLESQCSSERLELEDLERQQTELKQDIDKLNSLLTIDVETRKAEEVTAVEAIEPEVNLIDINDRDFDLNNAENTELLWQNIILPNWNHQDRPVGYRFLGNIDLDSQQSDRIINLVAARLENFSDIDRDFNHNLLKIITFSLSEYAYYSDSKSFWQGFCDRINIEHSQTVENALREIAEQGINLLGLIRAAGGYKYVSTLWLQSGIPKQNMSHFATILQDVANEYGWWELSHCSTEDIAEVLWQCWQNRYRQWGTIKHFLNPNNSNEDIEPIAGELVKNIAIVARELERQNLTPETISNRDLREEIIADSNISYSFFLRDWNDLVVVLDPRHGSNFSRISIRRNIEPYLYLDVVDTLNILLILPEQSVWKREWKNLRGTYCLIPEADWEGDIPHRGDIEIPELEIDLVRAKDRWSYQLQNHHRNEIYRWEQDGINSELPYLIFDAMSGESIKLNTSNPQIIGKEEIIIFTPREIAIELDGNIEIIDDVIPSSIRGWQGKEIRLIKSEALISIKDIVIKWRSQPELEPKLIGLRLKGKKAIYLDPPTFYYPPPKNNLTINYLIENSDRQSIVAKDIFYTYDSASWNSFDLSHHITEAGNYYITFWHQEKQWSYKFEVRPRYQVTQQNGYRNLEIHNSNNNLLSIPNKYTEIDKFWAEEIIISNLYPLESISFRLKNRHQQHQFTTQADSQGKINLALATLHNYLPKSDRYSLEIKQSDDRWQRILQVGNLINWKLIAKEIIFTELPSADNYCLSGWNLLNPDRTIEQINFLSNSEITKVELNFSPGIYLIQLYQNQQIIENIGFWCGINPHNIPDEITNNEALANYCYTILGNESLKDFSTALTEVEINFNLETIQIILGCLERNNYYLPEWLDKNSLTEKIQKILESLLQPKSIESNTPTTSDRNIEGVEPEKKVSGQWCLVTIRSYKRNLFLKYLHNDIEEQKLQQLILEIVELEESVYNNNLMLRVNNFAEARKILQQIENFQSIQRLKAQEANRMLNK